MGAGQQPVGVGTNRSVAFTGERIPLARHEALAHRLVGEQVIGKLTVGDDPSVPGCERQIPLLQQRGQPLRIQGPSRCTMVIHACTRPGWRRPVTPRG